MGVRVKGFDTGTLIFSVAIGVFLMELRGVDPGIGFRILLDAKSIADHWMHVVEPAILPGKVGTPFGTHILDHITGSGQFSFAFLGNHVVLCVRCRCAYSRE